MKSCSGEVLRFLLAGAFNTVATYLLYLGALQLVPYQHAYTAAFAIGIVLGYTINTRYVFHEPWRWRRLLAYPLVYVLQYLAGLAALWLLVENGLASKEIAPLLVIVVTIPLTFAASRFLIKGKPR
jgi:putative flippase GtrA